MIYVQLLCLIATLVVGSCGIDCSAKELSSYNFESLKGIHAVSKVKDTPPSQTNMTWYFGICESINEIEKCPKNSDICGITSINVDKDPKKAIISEIVGFNSNLQKTYKAFSKEGKAQDEDGISILYKGANWGDNLVDAELRFICPKKDDKDESLDKFNLDKWDGKRLKVSIKSKAACITSDMDKDKNKKDPDNKKEHQKPNEDNGESWGWFTWIFIFMVLFLSIYIIGGAWFQYNRGNSIDFQSALKEVLENFVDLMRGLPSFVKEIIEKFTGNSNRGEYSAV